MKILKVIVDEVPEGCRFCDFVGWEYPTIDTNILQCQLQSDKTVDVDDARPDWCPLVDNFMTLDEFQAALDE